jgi:hypothetical protein
MDARESSLKNLISVIFTATALQRATLKPLLSCSAFALLINNNTNNDINNQDSNLNAGICNEVPRTKKIILTRKIIVIIRLKQ